MEANEGMQMTEREKAEKVFHDKIFSQHSHGPSHYSLNPTFHIFLKMMELLGDIKGKKILECGCGNGWVTAELAYAGGSVHAFDISSEAVKSTKDFLARKNLGKDCLIEVKSAESIDYQDNTYDIVLGFAILHHLDLDKTIPEIHRVLKPSGIAIFAEPLEGNPFLRLYRKLTPQYRTPDEKPLVVREFASHLQEYASFTHHEFYLTALFPLFVSNFKLFRSASKLLKSCIKFDEYLFRNFPFLKKWAWYSILVIKK